MTAKLSDQQLESIKHCSARQNIWCGSVRSGKTFSSLMAFMYEILRGPKGDIIIVGVSRESIQRNIIGELFNLLGVPAPTPKVTQVDLFGRRLFLVGANDEGAVRKIQGATFACAYVDEIVLLPQTFYRMLLSRLSVEGAKLLATCNPAGPHHWVKKEIIDNPELNKAVFNFTLDDNPALSDSYKNELRKEYTGMWYQRYIMGEWAIAEGLVFDAITEEHFVEMDIENPLWYSAAFDIGTVNPTAGLVAAFNPQKWPQIYVMDEFYYNSRTQGRQKTNQELAADIDQWLQVYDPRMSYVDPSAASFKLELKRLGYKVKDAVNDVMPGIQWVNHLLDNRHLMFHPSCKNLRKEIFSYTWDTKAIERGEDKPVKKDDHLNDSLRYLCLSNFPKQRLTRLGQQNVNPDKSVRELLGTGHYGSDYA